MNEFVYELVDILILGNQIDEHVGRIIDKKYDWTNLIVFGIVNLSFYLIFFCWNHVIVTSNDMGNKYADKKRLRTESKSSSPVIHPST